MCADKRHLPSKQQGHTARKRFGQHFLTDDGIIDVIVRSIDPRISDAMVEIGPGLGALTNPVLDHLERLTVIELDRDLAARLRTNKKLDVIESDVLRVDFRALSEQMGKPLRVVGNLPYNISTPILFHLLPFANAIVDQHFMLQKEVVDRMVARPGSKDFSRLSVMLQWRYTMSNEVDVPPDAFDPPPRVDSAVVRMRPLPDADVAHIDAHRLGQLVTIAFSQRRKILRHTLGAWIREQGLDTTFDVQRRAEEVPVAEYVALSLLPSIKSY